MPDMSAVSSSTVNPREVPNDDTALVPKPNRYDHPMLELRLMPGLNLVNGRPRAASRMNRMKPRMLMPDIIFMYARSAPLSLPMLPRSSNAFSSRKSSRPNQRSRRFAAVF